MNRSLFACLLLPVLASFPTSPAMVEVTATDPALATRAGVTRWHDSLLTGTVIVRDADGVFARSTTEFRDGLRDGWSRAWYANGQTAYERRYAGGREVGEHRGWWPDGGQRFRYRFRRGLTEGAAQEWFPDGQLYREFHYRSGQEEGSQRMWYADGRLRANYVVRSGRRFGLPGSKGCLGADSLQVASGESPVARNAP